MSISVEAADDIFGCLLIFNLFNLEQVTTLSRIAAWVSLSYFLFNFDRLQPFMACSSWHMGKLVLE